MPSDPVIVIPFARVGWAGLIVVPVQLGGRGRLERCVISADSRSGSSSRTVF